MRAELKKIDNYIPEYWEGNENILVRLWTYLYRGLDFINQGRYLIIGILGIYALLKFTNPLWMAGMFIIAVPILIVLGRWHLYRVSKVQEFVTTIKGSVLGYNSYNVSVEGVELLQGILQELKIQNGDNHNSKQAG